MKRIDLLEGLAAMREGQPMVVGPGLANYPIGAHGDHPLTIYNMSMPYGAPLALGVALAWPSKKVVAIEGDGSLLAGPGVLTTIGRYSPPNFVVLVMDNGVYLSTGTGLTTTATSTGADLEKMANAAGITETATVSDLETAKDAIRKALDEPGPWLIVAKVDLDDQGQRGELPSSYFESGLRFRRAARHEIRAGQS